MPCRRHGSCGAAPSPPRADRSARLTCSAFRRSGAGERGEGRGGQSYSGARGGRSRRLESDFVPGTAKRSLGRRCPWPQCALCRVSPAAETRAGPPGWPEAVPGDCASARGCEPISFRDCLPPPHKLTGELVRIPCVRPAGSAGEAQLGRLSRGRPACVWEGGGSASALCWWLPSSTSDRRLR